jgi:hypothetical protein
MSTRMVTLIACMRHTRRHSGNRLFELSAMADLPDNREGPHDTAGTPSCWHGRM